MRFSESASRQDRAHFKRVRECARGCASEPQARQGGKGIPERIRCRAPAPTVSGRERTASSGAKASPSESRGGPAVLESLWRSPAPQKRGSSPMKKKEPTTVFLFCFVLFIKEKENPGESQSCSPLPPNPLVSSSDSSFPAGQRINTQINKPQSYLTPAHRSAYI